jgi:hypothetical protein
MMNQRPFWFEAISGIGAIRKNGERLPRKFQRRAHLRL